MPAFAAALSVHPVSSHATGEVVGRLLETAGTGPAALILAVTPGHAGAIEDIAAAARTLLAPRVLVALVASGVGADGAWVERGPAVALWAATGVATAPVGGPDRLLPPPGFETGGTIAFAAGARSADAPDPAGPDALGDLEAHGTTLAAGWVHGPVLLDGGRPGPGPVGISFAPAAAMATELVAGLRPVGPPLVVTRAERHMVYELDATTALARLRAVAADGMPAADLPRLGDGLHVEVTPVPGTAPSPPLAVLGADRDNGAIALAGAVPAGTVVRFAVRDPAAVAADLLPSLWGASAAVLLAAPAHGHGLDDLGATADGVWGPPDDGVDPLLPLATLTCATSRQHRSTVPRSPPRTETTLAAYFP